MVTIQREIVRSRNIVAEMDDHLTELIEEYFSQLDGKTAAGHMAFINSP